MSILFLAVVVGLIAVEDSVVESVVEMLLQTVYFPWSESSHRSLVSGDLSFSSAPQPSRVRLLLLLAPE